MRPMIRLAAAAVLSAATMAAVVGGAAEESRSGLVWLSGEEIRASFAGKPLAGIYPSGRDWNETIGADGTTEYREGTNHWHGRWQIRDREFCFTYPAPGVGGCFRVTRISDNCFELYEFESPLGSEDTPPDVAHRWNGRMWHADRPTTCEARPTV
jgi:hypothetical protein